MTEAYRIKVGIPTKKSNEPKAKARRVNAAGLGKFGLSR
jgi:hypothetical protein